MSLHLTLGTALTGLRVNQKAIEIASQNVANANTEGYSRQIVHRQALSTGGTGAGVGTAAITRTVDDFITREIRTQSAALSAETARDTYLSRTQNLFGSLANDTSFTARLTDLATRIGALANEPESATRRIGLVQSAQSFALAMNEASSGVQAMRRDAEAEIGQGVRTLNEQLGLISDLNKQIVHRQALGQNANELLDARDAAVNKVSELVDVQSFTRESGELVLYSRSGKPLVDGSAHVFGYTPAAAVGVEAIFADITLDGAPVGAELKAGKLKSLIELRDETLPGLQAQMDALAEKVRDQVNLAHNRGTALPAPPALTGTRTFADVNAEQITISTPVRIAAIDSDGTIQAYHDIPAGSYTIAGLRDLVNAQFGGTVTASAANGTGFSLAAGGGMGVAVVDLAGTAGDATVTHTADGATREYRGVSNFLGLNDLVVTQDHSPGGDRAGLSGLIAVRADIVADPSRLARGRLYDSTAAPPQLGQTAGLTSGATDAVTGMAAALDARVSFGATGGLPAFTGTVADYATQILSANAQQASSAASRMAYQKAVVSDLTTRAANVSGVSVDEEMANLVAWQNAYAASARVLTVASEMLDILTNLR